MAELSAPLTEWLVQAIPQEARLAHKSYPLVPVEDFEQEMWAKALKYRAGFEELLEANDLGKARKRLREAGFKLVNEDERYRRAIKAANAGYRAIDEQFYTTGILKVLLPYYLDGGISDRPPQGREQPKVTGSSGASDYLAMMLDLDLAWWKIKAYHRDILSRYFNPPARPSGYKNHEEIAGALGVPPRALEGRVYRGLRALERQLGGANPWNRRALEYQDGKDAA